jgi:hypothetical protein
LSTRSLRTVVAIAALLSMPLMLAAQAPTDVRLNSWAAPLYWQPSSAENENAGLNTVAGDAADTRPANSLVFVGMTPCRIVDTRDGTFPAGFGPPSLSGSVVRTFAIQSPSSRCPVPSIAQAYSFNITIVPPAFVDFVSVSPTPISVLPPKFSTLNGYVCAFSSSPCVISNEAIVPAGTSGSVDVYASQNTHLIIDRNGYYAQQIGITLTQGTAAAPSLSFAGDAGTGIFSSAGGALNIAAGGTSRIRVQSGGNTDVTGNLDVSGNVGIGTTNPASKLHVVSGASDMLPPRLESSDTNTFAAGLDIYHGSQAKGYVGVPDGLAGVAPNEMLLFGSTGVQTSLWANGARSLTLTTDGKVGVGTGIPLSKLDILGNLRASNSSSNDITVETGGGTNAWARLNMKSLNQHWALGTSRNFNGDQFYLYDVSHDVISMSAQPNGGAISFPVGNVGIGTTSPTVAKLVVNDTSVGTGVAGFSATGSGVFGQSNSAGGWGVFGRNQSGGYAMYADGNAGQARDKGGFVKAMLYVSDSGTILRCYNGITGSSTGNCGFTVNHFTAGGYGVDFGFQVNDRFVSVSPSYSDFNFLHNNNRGANFSFVSANSNTINVFTFLTDDHENSAADNFMIFVY